MKTFSSALLRSLSGAAVWASWTACPGGCAFADDGDWSRNFRLGAVLAYNMSADFRYGGNFAAPSGSPGATGVSGVNHVYDDGYVRVDNTGNAGGYTSFWGYQQASQYDRVHQTLTMHHLDSFTTSGGGRRDSAPYIGFDMAYGGRIADYSFGRIGWEFGFDLLPFTIKDNRTLQGTFVRSAASFDVSGLQVPSAPYNGGPSGVGPTLRDVATALPAQTLPGSIGGTHSLQGDLYTIRLGATWFFPLGPRWMVSGALGPALGVAPAQYRFSETFTYPDGTTAVSGGRFGRTAVQYGGYASAAVYFRVQPGVDIFAAGEAATLGKSRFESQGREADLRLGSVLLISAGFHWPF